MDPVTGTLPNLEVYTWGANSYGQLGQGLQSEQCTRPKNTNWKPEDCNINIIAGGGGHTLILNSKGHVYGCGWSNYGQLGMAKENVLVLTRLTSLDKYHIILVDCGWDSSYAITDDGCAFAWGSNKYGQLGIASAKADFVREPLQMPVSGIVHLSAGLRHTALVTAEGRVMVCGRGNKGQLGLINHSKDLISITESPMEVGGLSDVKMVACGQQHTLALTACNQVYVWGDNKHGQLGLDPLSYPTVIMPKLLELTHVTIKTITIHAGWTHSAILTDGKIISWGRNTYSQLGSSRHDTCQPQEVPGLNNVKQLVLGSEHNLALLESGDVLSWGWNEHGNCGTGTTEDVTQPTKVHLPGPVVTLGAGAGHSLAVVSHNT